MKSIIEQIIEKKKFEVSSTSRSDEKSLVNVSFLEALDLEVVRGIVRVIEMETEIKYAKMIIANLSDSVDLTFSKIELLKKEEELEEIKAKYDII